VLSSLRLELLITGHDVQVPEYEAAEEGDHRKKSAQHMPKVALGDGRGKNNAGNLYAFRSSNAVVEIPRRTFADAEASQIPTKKAKWIQLHSPFRASSYSPHLGRHWHCWWGNCPNRSLTGQSGERRGKNNAGNLYTFPSERTRPEVEPGLELDAVP
jgi:hypothetical protein